MLFNDDFFRTSQSIVSTGYSSLRASGQTAEIMSVFRSLYACQISLNPPVTFWVILVTKRQTDKRRSKLHRAPPAAKVTRKLRSRFDMQTHAIANPSRSLWPYDLRRCLEPAIDISVGLPVPTFVKTIQTVFFLLERAQTDRQTHTDATEHPTHARRLSRRGVCRRDGRCRRVGWLGM